jgi:hypothetical protein
MKKLFLTVAILAVSALAIASPFIVADPSTATKYQLRLSSDNGVTWGAWVQGDPVSGALKFDIGSTAAGNYKGEVQAGGNVTVTDSTTGNVSTVFKWSASAPFLLVIQPGQTVVGIKVIM